MLSANRNTQVTAWSTSQQTNLLRRSKYKVSGSSAATIGRVLCAQLSCVAYCMGWKRPLKVTSYIYCYCHENKKLVETKSHTHDRVICLWLSGIFMEHPYTASHIPRNTFSKCYKNILQEEEKLVVELLGGSQKSLIHRLGKREKNSKQRNDSTCVFPAGCSYSFGNQPPLSGHQLSNTSFPHVTLNPTALGLIPCPVTPKMPNPLGKFSDISLDSNSICASFSNSINESHSRSCTELYKNPI